MSVKSLSNVEWVLHDRKPTSWTEMAKNVTFYTTGVGVGVYI